MTAVSQNGLHALYRNGDDPWGFRTSAYEQAKFAATAEALLQPRYRSGLELGCGNGELSRHLAPRCDAFTGLDAVDTALQAARRAVPDGRFVQAYLPCLLPDGPHDLIVLSEVLYFLDAPGLSSLARQIALRWSGAELLSVIWLGPSGNALEGEEALGAFTSALPADFTAEMITRTQHYRIDRFSAS